MKKLKDMYSLEDLPGNGITSVDFEELLGLYGLEAPDGKGLGVSPLFEQLCNILGGTMYTQVDGDSDRCYVKGYAFVNRTGVYAIVLG